MADLVTRILLDDKQFNNNIQQSKQQVKDFEKGTQQLKAGMLQFAGAMGVAVSAGAIFQKTISGSQTLSDGFNNAMGAAKTTVDEFFSAMATGDFTVFTLGLDNIYKKALKAQEALDQLWNTQLSFDVTTMKTRTDMQQARETALDRDATPESRSKAMADWKAKADELATYTTNLQDQIMETVAAQVTTSSALRAVDVTLPDIFDLFRIDALSSTERDAIKEKADADFKEYQKEYNKVLDANTTSVQKYNPQLGSYDTTYETSDEGYKAGEEVAKKYKDAILISTMLDKKVDEQLKEVGSNVMKYTNLSTSISQEYEKINRAKHRVESQIGGGGKGITEQEIIPTQSIKAIDNQIREANDQLLLATTESARRTWDATIKELEAKKMIIEVQYKYTNPGDIGNVSTMVNTKGPEIPTMLSGAGGGSFEQPSSSLENYKRMLDEAYKSSELFTMATYGMSGALSSIGGAVDGSAGAWINWGSNILGAIGTAIPAIAALTTVQAASATVAAADAGAKGASAVAGIPIVGPIMAVAAVASIVAALATLPKFEHGGIVGGASFSGDNVLARVNSGEMILNKGQQGNLFKMINSGGGGGSQKIELFAKGKTLSAILDIERLRKRRV